MPSTPEIRSSARSGAARQRVLDSALRAIAANGFQGSSLANIAADAGLTTAGLLHHFPSKEQLLVAVLAERDRLDGARFQLAGFRGLAALDRLVELVQHNTMVPGLVQAYTVLMGESVSEDHPHESGSASAIPGGEPTWRPRCGPALSGGRSART